MATFVDDEWEAFLNDDGTMSADEETDELAPIDDSHPPKCGDIYISTKTKITYLNVKDIDIAELFWAIPIMPYTTEANGIIKKQIKITCETAEKYEDVMKRTVGVENLQINRIMRKNKKSVVLSNEKQLSKATHRLTRRTSMFVR